MSRWCVTLPDAGVYRVGGALLPYIYSAWRRLLRFLRRTCRSYAMLTGSPSEPGPARLPSTIITVLVPTVPWHDTRGYDAYLFQQSALATAHAYTHFSLNFSCKLTHHHLFTIQVVQHCVAVWATAELSLSVADIHCGSRSETFTLVYCCVSSCYVSVFLFVQHLWDPVSIAL